MPIEVLMPVITESGEDGVVTAWFVDEGSPAAAGQLIAEVQAEKVAADVHAPGDGIVHGLIAINHPVPQGSVICTLLADDEVERPVAAPPSAAAAAAPAGKAVRIIASPSAKRVARELNVDLVGVAGTGPGGRITEADVRAAADAAGPPGAELTGFRAVIARNMRRSVQETAPVTLTTSVDVTDTAGPPITAWVVCAAAMALRDHPGINGTRDGDRFVPSDTAHVAVAIQTDDGLVAPVLRDVAGSTVPEVAAEIGELAARARSRELAAADYEGATFTVTNLGAFGVDGFTPIINLPQVAILGVGALRTVPGFGATGDVIARKVLTLSLTFDHAFIDGAPAAEFLARVREILERGE